MAIGTYREAELAAYFDANLPRKRSRLWALAAGAENQDVNLEIGPVKIPFPAGIFRYFARSSLRAEGAGRWLRPNSPCLGVEELGQLQSELGLTDIELRDFAKEIRYECLQLTRDHPELALWVRRRCTLLDLVLEPPAQPSSDSVRAQIGLHQTLMQAVSYVYSVSDTAAIVGMVDELSATALNAAAQEVCLILGKGAAYVNANLMVPLRPSSTVLNFNPGSRDAVERAERLWQTRVTAEKCLMVVAETESAGHLGFWVPLARGPSGFDLPGAPAAYFRLAGNAVFKDDLPDLVGFSTALNQDWHDYVRNYLHEDLFVSLPFLVPAAPPPSAATVVASVLNVNVRPNNADSWRRAYHKEWMEIATARAAPFIEVAMQAFMVKMEAYRRAHRDFVALDTGSAPWNTLPGSEVVRLIEEKKR